MQLPRSRWPRLTRLYEHRLAPAVRALRNEHAEPAQIGQALALGAWLGTSPAIGLHGWLALGAATLLRRNRAYSFLGSRVSFFLLLPWIIYSEIALASWLRQGAVAPLDVQQMFEQAKLYLLDWWLGWLLLGPVYGALVGGLGYLGARAWRRRRRRAERQRQPEPEAEPAATGDQAAPRSDSPARSPSAVDRQRRPPRSTNGEVS